MTLVVVTTLPTRKLAEQIALRMVTEKLAACAQIGPCVQSSFRWKGRISKSREYHVSFKTTSGLYKKLENAICAHHPYEVPEVLAFRVSRGLPRYLRWIASSLR